MSMWIFLSWLKQSKINLFISVKIRLNVFMANGVGYKETKKMWFGHKWKYRLLDRAVHCYREDKK